MKSKNINDITLFRYLFNLDNRNLPQSILTWCDNMGSSIDSDREHAIKELSSVKGNCRNLVVFSKTFIQTMDKSYMKFTQFHMDILTKCSMLFKSTDRTLQKCTCDFFIPLADNNAEAQVAGIGYFSLVVAR